MGQRRRTYLLKNQVGGGEKRSPPLNLIHTHTRKNHPKHMTYQQPPPPPGVPGYGYAYQQPGPAAGYQSAPGYGYQQPVPPAAGQPYYQQPPPPVSPTYGAAMPAPSKYVDEKPIPQGVVGGGQPYGGGVVTGVPLYPDNPELGQRFVVQGPKDLWAAVLFVLQIVATVIVAFVNIDKDTQTVKDTGGSGVSQDKASVRVAAQWLLLAVFLSVVLCSIALALMRSHAKQYIWAANVLVILINIAMGVYMVVLKVIGAAIAFWFCAALNGLWLYCVRRRIPLSAELLSSASTVTTRHWGCVVTSLCAVVVALLYYCLFGLMTFPTANDIATYANNNQNNNAANQQQQIPATLYLLVLLFLLMLYWTMQVIFNVVHVTASGTMATWYFAGPTAMPRNPSLASFKRAMTTSFGSICFGSLIVAILKVIHFMARQAQQSRNGIAAACATCIIGCIEALVEYFNIYAYAHVAIYGSSFMEAAKQTWNLVKQCVWSAVINDNLVYPVLNLTIFFDAIAIGVICGVAAHNVLIGVASFLIAAGIHITVLRLVYSGVVTMFVCVAECPDALLQSNPALKDRLDDAISHANRGC